MYKSVNIIFLLHLKFYQNFKTYHSGKLNKTYFVNIYYAQPSKTVFWNLCFYICLNVYKLDDSFTFIWKKILCHLFLFLCHILSFRSSANLFTGSIVFDKFDSIIHELRWYANFNFENLSHKLLQILIFCRFLGQNSFELIAFCWVACYAF